MLILLRAIGDVFERSKQTSRSISIRMLLLLRAAGAGSCWSARSLRTYLGMDSSSAMGYALLVLSFYLKTWVNFIIKDKNEALKFTASSSSFIMPALIIIIQVTLVAICRRWGGASTRAAGKIYEDDDKYHQAQGLPVKIMMIMIDIIKNKGCW